MMKTPIGHVVGREFERIRYNPAYRFLLLVGPLLGILLLFFLFQKGVVTDLPIGVVDQDQSTLSVTINNALGSAAEVDVRKRYHDIFTAQKDMRQGAIEAIVLLPEDLQKNVYQGKQVPVPVYINGSNVLKAGLIQRSVLTTLKTVSGGIQLKQLQLGGKNYTQAMARVMPVSLQKHVLFNPYTNYNYFLNSAMLYVMLYLFAFLSAIYTLGNELKRGTGQGLLKAAKGNVWFAIMGKLLPYTLIFFVFAVLINLLLFGVEGMPLNGNFWILFFGQFLTLVSYQLMAFIFIGLTSNLRLALSLGSAYTMMGITFSGLTFPLEAMPLAARVFAAMFPFTWWEKLFISQALRGASVFNAFPYLGYILIFSIVSLCFVGVYKRYLQYPLYWGKR